jgi:hypothetical protein
VASVLARNLLSKDDWRAALRNEAVELWPEVAGVGGSFALARRRERLTGAGAGPNRSIVRPARKSEGITPPADPGEEMALRVAPEVVGANVGNRSLVNISWCDEPSGYEVSQPLSGIGIVLVVVRAIHAATHTTA